MAILDAEKYIRCKECKSAEFKVENRGHIIDNNDTYVFESNKCIVCCKCNKVYDTVGRFSGKIILER